MIAEATPVEVTEGDVVKLSCKVSGNPRPIVTWLQDGEPVETDNRVVSEIDGNVNSLCFRSTVLDDEGEYQCKAQNDCGSSVCTLELLINEIDVSEPQAKPEFLEKMVDLDVFEGDSPTFSVRVKGNPQSEVEWLSSVKEITTGGRFIVESTDDSHSFTINDCELKDKGRYKCVASNVEGKAVCSASLTVKERLIAPEFQVPACDVQLEIDEGSDDTLQAEVIGKPKPSVKWYKDDKPISRTSSKYKTGVQGNKHELVIFGAKPDDSGTYQCKATSPAGIATRNFNVNIKGKL